MSSIHVIFKKGDRHSDFLTVIGSRHSREDLEFENEADGLPLCLLQCVAEEVFGLVGPIRMLASGIDLNCTEGSFARTKIKILCLALQDQLARPNDDAFQFNQVVARLCRIHRHPRFLPERTSFVTAMQKLRQLESQIQKMSVGNTLSMILSS